MSGVINRTGSESGILGTTEKVVGAAPVITGGTKRTYSSGGTDYESRTFLDGGTINFIVDTVVDFILIAGGGAGGYNRETNGNGGGGAGGVVVGSGYTFPAGSYHIKIGEGAPSHQGEHQRADQSMPNIGGRGQDSYLGTFRAWGGGGGGSTMANENRWPSFSGGSGGGRARDNGSITCQVLQDLHGSTPNVTGYGSIGGTGTSGWGGAGGGGAGAVGQTAASQQHGHGGVGLSNSFETGSAKYLGGGGGGGGNSSENCGDGFYGGGRGAGSTPRYGYTSWPHDTINGTTHGSADLNAVPNTGGGGGGGSYWHNTNNGPAPLTYWGSGAGGSGYCCIRWDTSQFQILGETHGKNQCSRSASTR